MLCIPAPAYAEKIQRESNYQQGGIPLQSCGNDNIQVWLLLEAWFDSLKSGNKDDLESEVIIMTKKQYSIFHASIQKIASSKPGAWFFSKTQHHFDRMLLSLTNGKTTMTSILSGLPVVILTSKGAKSGQMRKTPLLYIQDETDSGKIALIASNWGQGHNPGWYYNLKANPNATGSINGQERAYAAHEAEGEEYATVWRAAKDTYLGFPNYKERASDRHIPIMVLKPVEE